MDMLHERSSQSDRGRLSDHEYAFLGLGPEAEASEVAAALDRLNTVAKALGSTSPEESRAMREAVRAIRERLLHGPLEFARVYGPDSTARVEASPAADLIVALGKTAVENEVDFKSVHVRASVEASAGPEAGEQNPGGRLTVRAAFGTTNQLTIQRRREPRAVRIRTWIITILSLMARSGTILPRYRL